VAGRESEEAIRRPASTQRWQSLTFLHWRYDPEVIRRLVPRGLEVDTRDGAAWVGVTPFVMVDVRLGRLPAVPGVSTFPETNLRTYVRGSDGRDGIWFFSLEAGSLAMVLAASALYGVPYRWADMTVEQGRTVRYRSRRRGAPTVGHDIEVRPGGPCEYAPGSDDERLDHWLTGRWRAYSVPGGRLTTTAVDHEPWPLREATVVRLEQSLIAAAGLPEPEGAPLARYTPGVDVALGVPRRVPRE